MFSLLKQQYQKLCTFLVDQAIITAHDPKLDAYADYAYPKCIAWFGPVQDPHWTYEINYAFRAGLTKDPFRKCYLIMLWRTCKEYEPLYDGIGHEMYHRVTNSRKGLRQIYWIDEMLAFLTAHHLLSDFGQGAYADYLEQLYKEEAFLSLKELSEVQPARGIKRIFYFPPDGFVPGILRIGIALEKMVGWENICSLVHCRTWEQWLSSLPDAMRQEAHRLLLPAIDPSAVIPFDASDIKRFRRLKSRSKYPQPIIIDKPRIDPKSLRGKHPRKSSSSS